jgi:hypothetical protein
LQRVLNDPAMISEYRERAMARVLELYNWEQITDEYEALLSKLAGIELVNKAKLLPITYPVAKFVEEQPAEAPRPATTLH